MESSLKEDAPELTGVACKSGTMAILPGGQGMV